jgi:hypothetical protein
MQLPLPLSPSIFPWEKSLMEIGPATGKYRSDESVA